MLNKVVIHIVDGHIQKGTTSDFFPNKDIFHFKDNETGETREILVKELKAVFFVKSFEGNPGYHDNDDIERVGFGKKIKIYFNDGETQVGYTQGYAPGRTGFFVFPSDPNSNNDRCFVVTAATNNIQYI